MWHFALGQNVPMFKAIFLYSNVWVIIMGKEYAYARISRKTQKIEHQIENLKKAYPDACLYQEAYTGTKTEGRKEFNKMLSIVKLCDTIIFDSVFRMSRNAYEGIRLYIGLYDKGVHLIFL